MSKDFGKELKECIIIGGGISGTITAIVLAKLDIQCTIYERWKQPATLGGAINLTASAVKLLKDLEVEVVGCECRSIEIFSYHSAALIGELKNDGPEGYGMRVMREVLMKGLLAAVDKAGVEIVYGSELVAVEEVGDFIVARFENGNVAKGDFMLGCDGMYSAVRMNYVEPGRKPIYTGAAAAYSIVDATNLHSAIHFKDTGVNQGMFGGLLTTFIEPERTRIYLEAAMEALEQETKEGWRASAVDTHATTRELVRRYGNAPFHCIPELIHRTKGYSFYPVYKLEDGGIWCEGRVLLLGDAAHGMPPRGESSGLAIEDAVLLGRVIERFPEKCVTDIFTSYEMTRKPRVSLAYKDATEKWGTLNDKTWVEAKVEELVVSVLFWWKAEIIKKSSVYDVYQEPILG